MSNVLVLSPQDSDAATLSASSQVATLPVANLQTIQPQKKWRSNGVTESIVITPLSALPWNALSLVGHNLTGAATIRVRGAATLGGLTSSPPIDTGAVSAWPATGKPTVANWPNYLSLVTWANVTGYGFWRIDIADAGNAAGYLEAGRLLMGTSWQPGNNFDVAGSPIGFDAQDTQTRTPFGYIFTSKVANRAARLFSLQITGDDKRSVFDGIAEIQHQRGLWGDVVCCLDPGETTDFHRFAMQGVFTTKSDYPVTPFFDGATGRAQFGAKLNLSELL